MVLGSCSNETWIIHSKLEKSEIEGKVSSEYNIYPIAKRYSNSFTYREVSGQIHLNNQKQYKEEKNLLSQKDKAELFRINVSLYQKESGNYLLSNIIGYIYLSNGRVLKPERIFGWKGESCYPLAYELVREVSYEIEFIPRKTCLVFEYKEWVDSREKFALSIGSLKLNNSTHELKFNFTPMIVKLTSH